MVSQIPEADEYDLSAIREHIKQVAKREEALTLDIKLKALKKNLPSIIGWFFLISIITSLLWVSISYGVRLIRFPPIKEKIIQPEIPEELKLNVGDLRIDIDSPISAKVDLESKNLDNALENYNKRLEIMEIRGSDLAKQVEKINGGIGQLNSTISSLSNDLSNIKDDINDVKTSNDKNSLIKIDPDLPEGIKEN